MQEMNAIQAAKANEQNFKTRRDAMERLARLSVDDNEPAQVHAERVLSQVGPDSEVIATFSDKDELPNNMNIFELGEVCMKFVYDWTNKIGSPLAVDDKADPDEMETLDWTANELERKARKLAETVRLITTLTMTDDERHGERVKSVLSE